MELKNGNKLRDLVGRYRYYTEYEVYLLNQIWKVSDLIDNFFIPSYKIIQKFKNSKDYTIKKFYDTPKTPYQRLIEFKEIPNELKEELIKPLIH